jgi:hypothetical protein
MLPVPGCLAAWLRPSMLEILGDSRRCLAPAPALPAAMLAAIVATLVLFIIKIGPLYPLVLMGPYILWVASFASCLTIWIWWHNRPRAGKAGQDGDVAKPEQEAVQAAEEQAQVLEQRQLCHHLDLVAPQARLGR